MHKTACDPYVYYIGELIDLPYYRCYDNSYVGTYKMVEEFAGF